MIQIQNLPCSTHHRQGYCQSYSKRCPHKWGSFIQEPNTKSYQHISCECLLPDLFLILLSIEIMKNNSIPITYVILKPETHCATNCCNTSRRQVTATRHLFGTCRQIFPVVFMISIPHFIVKGENPQNAQVVYLVLHVQLPV